MYIEPNGTVYLLGNVPLEPTYEHTILFTHSGSQQDYFLTGQNQLDQGITHFPNRLKIDKTYYQRVKRGYIRLGIEMNKAILYNYMAFQNDGIRDPGTAPTGYQFENGKWYYAFITHWEYINNEVTEIQYQIDVLQTYMFDYDLLPCLIDREIPATDNLFENLVPENINFGTEYINNNRTEVDLNEMTVAMLATEPPPDPLHTLSGEQMQLKPGNFLNGVYTPLYFFRANTRDAANADTKAVQANLTWFNNLVKNYVDGGKEDAIVTIYEYPNWLDYSENAEKKTEAFNVITTEDYFVDGTFCGEPPKLRSHKLTLELPEKLDNYTPVNKKLYTYPYNFITISNNAGQTCDLKWENTGVETSYNMELTVEGIAVTSPCISIHPNNYRGIVSDYDSAIQLASFPECAWKGNAFAEWYAQNHNRLLAGQLNTTISGVANSIISQSALPAASAVTSLVTNYISIYGQAQDIKAVPPQAHGKAQTDSFNAAAGHVEFSIYRMSIKQEFAKIIDAYFSRYGYASHQIKVPNIDVRPTWTYTKTVGCAIKVKNGHPAIPADYVHDICQIFDNGITFWKNPKEVGDYSDPGIRNAPSA